MRARGYAEAEGITPAVNVSQHLAVDLRCKAMMSSFIVVYMLLTSTYFVHV